MTNPGITVLEKCLDDKCRYTLVSMVAKRARMLAEGDSALVEENTNKPVSTAVHEIAEGRVKYKRDMKSIEEINEFKKNLSSNIIIGDITEE